MFQWVPAADAADLDGSGPGRDQVEDEIADVLIYLLHLADAVGIDPLKAATAKLERNRSRFPSAQAIRSAPGKN